MNNYQALNSLSIGLLKQDNWAYFGAKKLVETSGLSPLIESRAENFHDVDMIIVPRVIEENEDVLLHLASNGCTLITEGGIAGTEFERALGVSEQSSTVQSRVVILHSIEGSVLLPALLEYFHKSNCRPDAQEQYYEIDGNEYLFSVERSIGRGKVILLSSLFSLVSKTYSWTSETICNQELSGEPYLDYLSGIFIEVITKEASLKNKILARLWYFPDFRHEAAMLVTFDIDDKYSYQQTITRSPYERDKRLAFTLLYMPFSKLVSKLKRVAEQRISTKSKETAGIGFFTRLWKRLNRLITPNFLELVERNGAKAVLFLRPPSIQAQEIQDKTCHRLESYQITREQLQGVSAVHEIGLHFGRSLIKVINAQSEEVKSYWTSGIKNQMMDLEKATGMKIYGSRGHYSLFFPETIEQLEMTDCWWDSTYYGQQRWVSRDGKLVEFGYEGPSPSWTASIVGTSLPFYPIIAKPGLALRESSVLEFPTTLYEPRGNKETVLDSLKWVLEYHGVINIQYHPFDASNYYELERILRYLRGKDVWRTTGKELATWWQKSRRTKICNTKIRVSHKELFVESEFEATLNTFSLTVDIPKTIDISGVSKISSNSLKVHDYEIDYTNSVVKLHLQTIS